MCVCCLCVSVMFYSASIYSALGEDVDLKLIAFDETARLRADGGMNIFMAGLLIGLWLC